MEKINLLDDLERWQACSQGVLAHCGPQELFDPTFVERYDQLHRDLWHRLIHVHGTLSTLEQLEKFPFAALYGPHDMEFWRLVTDNFFITAVVMLRALVSDPKPNAHTVRTFRERIVNGPWVRTEDRELFMQTLQERRFDSSPVTSLLDVPHPGLRRGLEPSGAEAAASRAVDSCFMRHRDSGVLPERLMAA